MDREEFREQITRRYIAGKAMEGASLDEIARGMVDPVEQMTYIPGQAKQKSTSAGSTGSSVFGWFILIVLFALALLSGAVKLFL